MGRNAYVFCCLVLTVSALGGCARERSEPKNAGIVRDRIQGKTQIMAMETTTTDKALSAGGPSVYVWQDLVRYRLFLKTPAEIEPGKEYVIEGVHAQKIIDELGDPDQGSNGYPLLTSCKRVVKTAWPGMAMDLTDSHALTLRDRVRRYPARPVFLVTRIQPATAEEGAAGSATAAKQADSGKKAAAGKKVAPVKKEAPELTVTAEIQKARLLEGPTVQPAPLWEPAGGTVRCKVLVDEEGRISELQTGAQLCESVPWSRFRYQPTVERGRPAKVNTEVEIRFEPRKIAAAS